MKIITRTEWAWDSARGTYLPTLVESHDYRGEVAMCMGGGGGDDGSHEARVAEAKRQFRVKEENELINEIFNGGAAHRRGTDQIADLSMSPGSTYFDKSGNAITLPGDPNDPGYAAAADKAYSTYRSEGLYGGYLDVPEEKGFNDAYFNNIADAYTKFQKPLYDEQLAKARRELPYQFSSSDSAEYLRKKEELERDASREQANLADQAQGFANNQRSQVEQNRSDLIGMASGGADVNSVVESANARAAALAKPPVFSPIADLFQKYTAASTLNPGLIGVPAGMGQPLYFNKPTSFAPGGGGSVKVIG